MINNYNKKGRCVKCDYCKGLGYVIHKSNCIKYKHCYTNKENGERIDYCYYCYNKKP